MQMNLFYNCESIFIEYMDVIKPTQYYLLDIIKNNEKLSQIMNLEQIRYLGDIGKVEWYLNRKNKNILKELCTTDIPDDELDNMLYKMLSMDNRLDEYASKLNFFGALNILSKQNIVKNIFIYLPYEDHSIEETFHDFKFSIRYLYGDLKECLEKVPSDSTYVFSDIDKVNVLNEMGKLQMASVMIPKEYRYNKKDTEHMKIDFTKLNKEIVFKYALFNAFIIS